MTHSIEKEAIQLAYVNLLFTAVNKSCRQMHGITYASGDADDDCVLSPFETFLCKLALICDTKKGGDTITGLVALKGDDGPKYLFTQNNAKAMELEGTKNFLKGLLMFVSLNPDDLDVKPLQKAVLWRILEFNFLRVKLYIKQVEVWVEKCIENCDEETDFTLVQALLDIKAKAHFPRDINASENAKFKCLKDSESLIKAIHAAKEKRVSERINRFANANDEEASHPWRELRHCLGRLHAYRIATETIIRASSRWPELFKDFNVEFIPSSRAVKLPLTQPEPPMMEVIRIAFPNMNLGDYMEEIRELEDHRLQDHLKNELRHRSLRQCVHCEVHLHDFLVRDEKTSPSQYWNNSMFIATSKPSCRLCHYYFDNIDDGFKVQSSHMNLYPKWRLPSIGDEQEGDSRERQRELLEDIIEQMQNDTLEVIREKFPQWKRNDSRTESRGLTTGMSMYDDFDNIGAAK